MDGLSPNALNLSTTEQSSYTLAFRELADLSDQDHPGDYCIMLTRIPEVRGWFKDRFFTLSLGQIDQILQMTCVKDSSSIYMTDVGFFASLRIALHAQAGAGVVLKSAFEQVSGLSPLLRTSASSRPQHDIASRLPSEILTKIFDLTLMVMGRYCYKPQYSLVPFATVNKWWSGVAHYLLYRSISVHHGEYSRNNVVGMLRRTLSEDPRIATRVMELRVGVGCVEDHKVQDFFALFDLCVNLKHADIFGYRLHSLECCRRVLARRNLISIHIRMENYSRLKDPAFCSTGCLLEMMQGWPDLETLHISHITSSAHTHVRNNCCPRLKVIYMNEGEFSADLLRQLPKITQALERLHLRAAWVYEFPASSVFFAIRAWKNSLKWLHYAPKRQLDVHPSQHPHLPHLKFFETNSTGLPASYLRIVSPNVSTFRYMATMEDFHYITTNLYDLTFLPSLTLLYISPLPDWSTLSSSPEFPEDDVRSLKTICVQRSIQLIFKLFPFEW